MTARRTFAAGACVVVAAACGIDALGTLSSAPGDAGVGTLDGASSSLDGSSDDGGAPGDGGGGADDGGGDADAGVPVVALCDAGAVYCSGACVAANDCSSCSNAKLLCARTRACAADCAGCPERPIQCFACDSSQNNPVGTCESTDAGGFCLNADYGSGEHCDCSNTNVANCLGSQHVCLAAGGTDWCVTCGEKGLATNGKACKGGGTCNAMKSPPGCE